MLDKRPTADFAPTLSASLLDPHLQTNLLVTGLLTLTHNMKNVASFKSVILFSPPIHFRIFFGISFKIVFLHP